LLELQEYWDLIFTLSVHRVKVRYKQSLLGISWTLFQPLSMMLLYTILFSYMAKVDSDNMPYPVFAFGGLLPWLCFQTALTGGINALVTHAGLITKVYFPREILPLTYVIASLFDFAVASTILAGMMVYYHVPIRVTAFYAIPIMVLLALFVTSVSLVMSILQVRFRDIGVAIPLLLQIWMFATPVVYSFTSIRSLPSVLRTLYMLNPLVGIIENFRRTVVLGLNPEPISLSISVVVSLILFPLGYVYFKHVECTVADKI
jgi:lipopolysaccharide transport system permease protein